MSLDYLFKARTNPKTRARADWRERKPKVLEEKRKADMLRHAGSISKNLVPTKPGEVF